MRDAHVRVGGLATRVWLPGNRLRAVLVVRTPYGAAQHEAEALGWARHGVGLVVQDVRGRHESPGDFHPYAEDGSSDGPELLAWVRTWADVPVILLGTSYGAHTALATAVTTGASEGPDAVVVAVPAVGLGETARTRGGVLQLASRIGWWLAQAVPRPWEDVVAARRTDLERAAAVSGLRCSLLAIGGTDDFFAHDTLDLWRAWGGPAQLVLGPWGHELAGARRARRILAWLDDLLDHAPPSGVTTVDRAGTVRSSPPPEAVVQVEQTTGSPQWCASLLAAQPDGNRREVAHGAAIGLAITLGPLVLTDAERDSLELRLSADDFPRYARSRQSHVPVPEHHLELTA